MLRRLALVNRLLFQLAAALTVLMALLGFAIVLARYGFNAGSIAAQELVIYAHAFVLLGAAAATLADDAHVRVDIFYSRWPARRRALIDLLGSLLLLWPLMAFVLWSSWGYVGNAWRRHEASAEPGGLPWVYLLKSLILLFAAQMILQGLIQAQQAWRDWRAEEAG